MSQYKRTTKASLEGDILIEIRRQHIHYISEQFINCNIVSKEYLDNLIKIETQSQTNINTNSINIYTNEKRIAMLDKHLQKECSKETAKLINELIKHK